MRVELHNERYLLCGHILRDDQIKVGQKWAGSSAGTPVTIVDVQGDWVSYEGESQPLHEKSCFAFQCRYCLVLDGPEIPKGFL